MGRHKACPYILPIGTTSPNLFYTGSNATTPMCRAEKPSVEHRPASISTDALQTRADRFSHHAVFLISLADPDGEWDAHDPWDH